MPALYQDQTIAFLTQHGKEDLLRPLLAPALGCQLVRAEGFDTDTLGTFSGEIPRPDTQLQTARQKARLGMDLLGQPVGMASEGAFVPDPFGGMMPWNVEMLVWLDDTRGLEIVGMAQGPARSGQRAVRTPEELQQFAAEAGFPEHQLVLRPQSETDPRVHKGLASAEDLQQAFAACLAAAPDRVVYAENDLRAFSNPTRQRMIVKAGEDLLQKLQSACPQCALPGFAPTGVTRGLPCGACGHPTQLPRLRHWRCVACAHQHDEPVSARHADPSRCDVCNP
ncbi:MAG: hypothetical protein FGM28_01490 [Limnohabitans sp.]|jgi:ferredoxin|nr:hypothetical protein [Limnohabitans sp.]